MSKLCPHGLAACPMCPSTHVLEGVFQGRLLAAINAPHRSTRVERQNVGTVPVRDARGKIQRFFRAGPRKGAGDLRGWAGPEGRYLEIEIKSGTGKLSLAQRRRAAMLARFGAIYLVVRYDEDRDMQTNVRDALALIDAAIAARRAC